MSETLILVFILLLIYQAKHFLADFPLQGVYMLGKFKSGWDFFLPLLAHVSIHGLFTLAICLWVNPVLWWLALVDSGIHFVMDRIKAGPKYLGRFKALSSAEIAYIFSYKDTTGLDPFKPQLKSNVLFWWSLGLDQAVHHLTHYLVIYILIVNTPL